jgi:hypothetical protein
MAIQPRMLIVGFVLRWKLERSTRDAEGITAISRWSSERNTTGSQPPKRTHPGRGATSLRTGGAVGWGRASGAKGTGICLIIEPLLLGSAPKRVEWVPTASRFLCRELLSSITIRGNRTNIDLKTIGLRRKPVGRSPSVRTRNHNLNECYYSPTRCLCQAAVYFCRYVVINTRNQARLPFAPALLIHHGSHHMDGLELATSTSEPWNRAEFRCPGGLHDYQHWFQYRDR